MLGRKQNITNDEWLEAVEHIKETVKKKDLDAKVKETMADIKVKTKGKKAAYSWSAGKDSIVLGDICRRAGIKDCVLVVSDLEYPEFADWIDKNKPQKPAVLPTKRHDLF